MRFKILTIFLGLIFLIGTISSNVRPAYASIFACTASPLDPSQEVPPVDSEGFGSASVTFDSESNELSWNIEFSELSGNATAAHFHGPAAIGANAGVQVNIGEISGLSSPMIGSTVLTPEQESSLLNGQMYINIHTELNPDGEIRGQVSCVESPTDGGQTSEGEWQTMILVISGEEYDIQYMISNGELNELIGDPETATITAMIIAEQDGELTIQLPRNIIDSVEDGEDANYVVIVDDVEESADDDFGDEVRILTIPFASQSKQIDIIGTFVVPEFGAIAAIVLAVAIVSIIVATTRYSNKFSFLPKV
jgi:predicted secreted protein with PEFG-CTERM motif